MIFGYEINGISNTIIFASGSGIALTSFSIQTTCLNLALT